MHLYEEKASGKRFLVNIDRNDFFGEIVASCVPVTRKGRKWRRTGLHVHFFAEEFHDMFRQIA